MCVSFVSFFVVFMIFLLKGSLGSSPQNFVFVGSPPSSSDIAVVKPRPARELKM